MAGAYLLQLPAAGGGKTTQDGVDALVVWAEGATDAKMIAKAQQVGTGATDAAWDAVTPTLLAAGDFEGWRLRITVTGPPSGDVDVTVTGAASADMDALAALAVTALNATADIANSSYSTPNLTIASGSGGDDLGDKSVAVYMYPPLSSSDFPDATFNFSNLIGTITHEGSSTDALAVALDTSAPAPTLIARLKQ